MILGRVNTIYNPLALLRLTLSFGRSLRTLGQARVIDPHSFNLLLLQTLPLCQIRITKHDA